jgi:predicted CoA-binding protein
MDISDSPERVRDLLASSRVVAVVGASDKPERPSNDIARFLLSKGYTVIPVNPLKSEILGQKCYPELSAVPVKIDIVDIFRNPADVPPVVEGAIAAGARCVWMQSGIEHSEAARRASEAGLLVVQDRCIKVAHRTLMR